MSLVARPYAERQRIVIVDDVVAEADRRATSKGQPSTNWANVVRAMRKPLSDPWLWMLGGGVPSVVATIEGVKAILRMRREGVAVLTVGHTEAAGLVFPPGHPQNHVLYIGHPAVPTVYYPAAHFHRLTFEHKFAEAAHLLMSLGATKMEVEHVKGWMRDVSSMIDVPVGGSGVQVGAHAGLASSASRQILLTATLRGSKSPSLPGDLVWYPNELTWQQIAEGRLQHGLREFSLMVRYEDDFGVNSDLKIAVSNVGIGMGGNFENYESTLWRITGEFGDSGQ